MAVNKRLGLAIVLAMLVIEGFVFYYLFIPAPQPEPYIYTPPIELKQNDSLNVAIQNDFKTLNTNLAQNEKDYKHTDSVISSLDADATCKLLANNLSETDSITWRYDNSNNTTTSKGDK